jgi:ssDNA-binding replication factor A large subunit
MEGNYERIIKKISESSGLEKEEIERKIEAKKSKLSGFISKEGAAQIIAAELGISFEDEKLKIEELLPGMRKVNVTGKIINLSPIRKFTSRQGEEGKVSNFILADKTSNIKTVLWDVNHIALIEKGEIKENSVVEIFGGSIRNNELHLGSFSELKLINEDIGDVRTDRIVKEKSICDCNISDNAKVRAFVVQMFGPRFFYVCPECRKKVVSGEDGFICQEHGKVIPEKRALINVVLDDGTETIRAVLFNETISKLGFNDLEDSNNILQQRDEILGKEMYFYGSIRNNKFFNNSELIVEEIQETNIDELIKKLENLDKLI